MKRQVISACINNQILVLSTIMTGVDLSAYKDLYLQTARKYLVDMSAALTALQSDKTKKESIETMYISAHSLKSQSQIMTFALTGALSGTIEFLFRDIREGKAQISDETLQHLQNALQKLTASIDSIEKNNQEMDLNQDISTMKQFTGIS